MAIDTIKSTAVLDGAIATADIADDAVTTAKIADDAVTTDKLANSINTDIAAKSPLANPAFTGKVGIGTSSPIDLTGSTSPSLTVSSVGPYICLQDSNNADQVRYMANNSGELQFGKVTDDGSTVKAEHMRITASGDIGFGTTTPDTKVQIKGTINSAQLILGGTDGRGLKISTFNQGGQNDGTAIYDAQDTEGSAVNSHHVFKSGGTETLRIRGDGDLFWHDTPSSSAAGIGFTNITHPSISISGGADTNYRHRIVFVNGNGTVGIISTSGSSTAYGTSSDYRLKENVDYTWDATTRLKQLKPARFNFIADPDTTVDGFLAHEAQSVVPESVTGTHNGMKDEEYEVTPAVLDDDGNITTEAVMGTRSVPDIQGIDQSKLVPLLVKTIQELEARITALEDA
jgi:hypothetical protein